jgi:hypothetical protein
MQVIQIVRHGLVPANHSDVNHLHVADHACTNMTFVAGNKLLDQGRLWNSVLCPRIEGPSAPVPIPFKCSTSSCNKRKHSQKTCLKTKVSLTIYISSKVLTLGNWHMLCTTCPFILCRTCMVRPPDPHQHAIRLCRIRAASSSPSQPSGRHCRGCGRKIPV